MSMLLNIIFILLVLCQLSHHLAASKHTKEVVTVHSRERHHTPQIRRITANPKNGNPQEYNPSGKAVKAVKAKVPGAKHLKGGLTEAKHTRDAHVVPHFLYVILHNTSRKNKPRHQILTTLSRPRGRHLSRTLPANRSIDIDSGLNIRLKGNYSVNEGLVEVRINNKWGFVCADEYWNDHDSRVVCRQLGFSSPADDTRSIQDVNRTPRVGTQESFVMSQVACTGSENYIQNCTYNARVPCAARRPARVRCALNSGCQAGWLGGNGFCYNLINATTTFDDAEKNCRSLDAYLVKIENQQENNFISNLLFAENEVHRTVWTSGRRIEHGNQIQWSWLGSSYPMEFNKWFPGWTAFRLRSEPSNAGNHSCIALSRAYSSSNGVSHDFSYYFWAALPCIQKLPFVCKKVAPVNDCYDGNGTNYRGKAFITTRASVCEKWTKSTRINSTTHPNAGLGDHNYCRNPDGDKRPWCWVDARHGLFGYCELPACLSSRPTSASIDVPLVKVRLQNGQNDHEGRVEVWYEGQWGNICNDLWDSRDADVVCRQLGFIGALRTSRLYEFSSGDGVRILLDDVQCTGLENSLYDCTHNPWGEHDCRTHEIAGVVCKPNKVCVEEKEIQCQSSQSQTCVPLPRVCDRAPDCSDGSDEADCSHFEVALVDGSRPSEGRVQITVNNITGTVCDDDWDDKDAAVICRMLGYSMGVAQAVTGAQFGRGRGPIWLDNVECTGSEDDIQECDHRGWGEHNCMHNEDAGVFCMISRTPAPTVTYSSVAPECGRRSINQALGRIVGGQITAYGAYPWQARILKRNLFGEYVHSCGGTVIGQRWILSAAHCFQYVQKQDMRIVVGDYKTTETDAYEQGFSIDKLFVHTYYSNLHTYNLLFGTGSVYDYDIALVKIHSVGSRAGMRFNNYVQPACLPTASTDYTPGLICEVSGWGLSGRSTPHVLMSAMVPIRQQSECQQLYRQKLSRKMFCAGYRDGHADTCQGDSGGPLVCNINGTYTIMGITSWGLGCGYRDSPGVYTKVGELIDWIDQIIRRNS